MVSEAVGAAIAAMACWSGSETPRSCRRRRAATAAAESPGARERRSCGWSRVREALRGGLKGGPVWQATAGGYCGGGIAGVAGAAFLWLEQVEVAAAGCIEGVTAWADGAALVAG